MDPIIIALADLRRANIPMSRVDHHFIEAYQAPGYPELTRRQVFDLAQRHGVSAPEPRP